MPIPSPSAGLILHYSYLWAWEAGKGRQEGHDDRPAVIVALRMLQDGQQIVVCPVTHSHTGALDGIEIPYATKQRLGLDDHRSWVVTTEANKFIWLGLDIRPLPRRQGVYFYGMMPNGLLLGIQAQVRVHLANRNFKMISRETAA